MIEIKDLQGVGMQQLVAVHNKAFEDYAEPIRKTEHELEYMLKRRGYDAALSFGAFDGDEIVSFIFNGIDTWNNMLTAYDTGTGTVQAYRQQGLASQLLSWCERSLKERGVEQYLLEVIKVNTKAAGLYRKAGFAESREFDYYIKPLEEIDIDALPATFEMRKAIEPDWDMYKSFESFAPSWQNSKEAIQRQQNHFDIWEVVSNDSIIGYGIVEPQTGDVPQLAIAPGHRRKGIGTALLKQLIQSIQTPALRIINTDATYAPWQQWMRHLGIQPGYGQYEMIKKL